MNTSQEARGRNRTDAAQRAKLLAEFACSGLSAAAFARRHGLNYTTFCGWRQRQGKSPPSPDFVPVELTFPEPSPGLIIELGAAARVRLWGFGFTDRPGTPDDALTVINWFKSAGCTVMGGVP